MNNIEFGRGPDKKRRKRRRDFVRSVKRNAGYIVDQQIRPFRGPSRKERIMNNVSSSAQLGMQLGVAAVGIGAGINSLRSGGAAGLQDDLKSIAKKVNNKRKGLSKSVSDTIASRNDKAALRALEKQGLIKKIDFDANKAQLKAARKDLANKKAKKSRVVKYKKDKFAKKAGYTKKEFKGITSLAKRGSIEAKRGLRSSARKAYNR